MIYLGKVVHLQVQEFSLKVGEGARQRYDRAGLRVVDELELNDGGVRGFRANVEITDVHHRDHTLTKLRGTQNAISFGFTGHYDRMRNRFGSHFDPAVAGENILIDHDGRINLADVEKGLVIKTADGRSLNLTEVFVAAPCSPFTRWALQFPDDAKPDRTVTEGLQFLDDGMRGYYCRYTSEPARCAGWRRSIRRGLMGTSGTRPAAVIHFASGRWVCRRLFLCRVRGVRGRLFERT